MVNLLTADKARENVEESMKRDLQLTSILDTIKLRSMEGRLFYNVCGYLEGNTKEHLIRLGYTVSYSVINNVTEINW